MAQVRDIKISDALKFPGISTPLICFKQNDIWLISLSETLVSGSTIMAQVRDIKISDALTFPGIFTALICFKKYDIWLISLSETLVSGSKIMAQVRDIKISDALKFPGILLHWYASNGMILMHDTLRNVSVRFHDYGLSTGH